MRHSFAAGFVLLFAAASCGQPDIVSVKAPPVAPKVPPPTGGFNGVPVDGRWSIAPAAHFVNLTVEIKEGSTGRVTGKFSGDWEECGCTVTGRVTETGAPFASVDGSYREGRAVRLFLSFGQDPVAPFKPFAWYDGLLIDSTHAVGSLSVITGEGYFGDDGYGQSDVEMRKSGGP